jgi:hypothetical protein
MARHAFGHTADPPVWAWARAYRIAKWEMHEENKRIRAAAAARWFEDVEEVF